jgi:hypothetical protein
MRSSLQSTLIALAGCLAPTNYVYAPEDACQWTDGYPAATQPVPAEAPQGAIELSSSGFVEIREDQRERSALHVRLTVTNDGDAAPWTIVPGDQVVEVPGEQRTLPMAMKQALPMNEPVVIEQHDRQMLDLYFALPSTVDSEDTLMSFDLLWQLTTPARPYSSRTRFERYMSTHPSLWSCADRQ